MSTGSGGWYLARWRGASEEEGHFHVFGYVLLGEHLAVLRIDHGGQDHDYPPGQDPMVAMVRAAAARLG